MNTVNFVSGKKKTRDELRLPQQHFIAMDDWVQKIGAEAYIAWLKFYTYVNRKGEDNGVIPNSMNKIIQRLGSNKKSFYQKIIRPLWNFGFIDLEEVHVKAASGVSASVVNIIVYEYPQNDVARATKPLEQIRDYDTEYQTKARDDAKKGGRKKSGFSEKPGGERFPEETGSGFSEKPGEVSSGNPIINQIDFNVLNGFNVLEKEIDRLIDADPLKIYLKSVVEKLEKEHIEIISREYQLQKNRDGFTIAMFVQKVEKTIEGAKSNFSGFLNIAVEKEIAKINAVKEYAKVEAGQKSRQESQNSPRSFRNGKKKHLPLVEVGAPLMASEDERAAARERAILLDRKKTVDELSDEGRPF